jgi:O-phospho-L-seryl-tRNASec:L-selenocysteinyl-tRNA synthase
VVWPRIDQKTCLKCIRTANLEPLVVEEKLVGDALTTDVEAIDKVLRERPEEILCVLTTSSCFAPRVPDSLEAVSQLCKKYDVAHVLNNAYGLQCSKIANAIKESMRQGRLDCVVQSTDKNFMVPVGGSLIFSQRPQLIKQISEKYPGRACSSPIVDLFITLLEMGKTGIKRLYKERKENFKYMKEKAQTVMQRLGERVLETRDNSISLGLTLGNILKDQDPVELGSVLYSKKVMGHRILTSKDEAQKLCGNTFSNYGSHHQHYPFLPYMTIACAIGTQRS